MCGITGIFNLTTDQPITEMQLRQMLAMIRHRGPDQFGIFLDTQVGLGSARLSIIDLTTGQQPIGNEDGSLWIVFNGEIFNYVELRPELEARGHQFTTTSDTEVILHLYEEMGPACLSRLNGQFSIAIWDARKQQVFLARDRLGIRPLFYTIGGGALIFGSEMKSLLSDERVQAAIDPVTLDQIFTFWSPLSPRSIFQNIQQVPPGHYLLAGEQGARVQITPYWEPTFDAAEMDATENSEAEEQRYVDELLELLVDATRIRLRADVPVGAYLSGGLDSSVTAAIIRNYTDNRLDTFSIAFGDATFDESPYQRQMADFLGTDHQVVHVDDDAIGDIFPDVIWHTETPILRTAPAPMYLLSRLVRENNYKVVLTGEGADEFLAGYNIFKEAQVRRFWAKQPDSTVRPLLLKRLYPYIGDLSGAQGTFLTAFFGRDLQLTDQRDYSHRLRWHNTARTRRFFSGDFRQQVAAGLNGTEALENVAYPADFDRWDPLQRAQYLEISIFLSQYLLSSQGDRMAMANAVEGRYPFLDYRVVEFCNRLPSRLKLRGMTEKYLLKRLGQKWLPDDIWKRPKKPYRAPIHHAFFNENSPDYARELLDVEQIRQAGIFNPQAVSGLARKIESGAHMGETDDMALAGILSTMLARQQFVTDFRRLPPLSQADDVKVVIGARLAEGES